MVLTSSCVPLEVFGVSIPYLRMKIGAVKDCQE